MENNQKEDISKFIESVTAKYGFVPKFAHNIVAKDKKKVYYSGPYFDNSELVVELASGLGGSLCGRWAGYSGLSLLGPGGCANRPSGDGHGRQPHSFVYRDSVPRVVV